MRSWLHSRGSETSGVGSPSPDLPSLGAVNLALLAFYFIPAWGRSAVWALTSRYNGLDDRIHATTVIYFRNLLDLDYYGLVVTSHVVAGIKLVIAAAFIAYLIEFARAWTIRREADRDTIDLVLILAAAGIFVGILAALALGEAALVRLYATQMMLVAGAIMVVVVERHVTPEPGPAQAAAAENDAEALPSALPVGVLAAEPDRR